MFEVILVEETVKATFEAALQTKADIDFAVAGTFVITDVGGTRTYSVIMSRLKPS